MRHRGQGHVSTSTFKFRVPQPHCCASALEPALLWGSTWGIRASASPAQLPPASYVLCTFVSPLPQPPPRQDLPSFLRDHTAFCDARPAQVSAALWPRSANSHGHPLNCPLARPAPRSKPLKAPPQFPITCSHTPQGRTLERYRGRRCLQTSSGAQALRVETSGRGGSTLCALPGTQECVSTFPLYPLPGPQTREAAPDSPLGPHGFLQPSRSAPALARVGTRSLSCTRFHRTSKRPPGAKPTLVAVCPLSPLELGSSSTHKSIMLKMSPFSRV